MRIRISDLRKATQLFAFFWANSYIVAFLRGKIYEGPLKSSCVPFLNCHACPSATFSCPVGTVQHYMSIHRFPLLLTGQLGLIGMLVGRMACGWLCPAGLLQDLLHLTKLGQASLSRAWGYARWLVLGLLVIAIPWITAEHWFSKLCPVGTLIAGIPWAVWDPIDPATGLPVLGEDALGLLFAVKIGIVLALVGTSLFIKRPFCRVLCPLGLFFSFFNRISVLSLRVTEDCDHCDACAKLCPMDIKVYEEPNHDECIRCLECTSCAHVKVSLRVLASGREASVLGSIPAGRGPFGQAHIPAEKLEAQKGAHDAT